ncbi:hypothetical protein BAE44_0012369 [Dichanthelium oligosanthes]|uniref:No apical meristem-associated C-terminal domain-containing protein n=1 Tax=Dichanthelium oligosanthes TaxID=888268 RepID=A0A1E5VNA0_9POAL|nr:hypothetical protein BAE44_0012369 [Dichanthelium oligosanthes]
MGRDAAKASRKRASSTLESQSSEYVSKMSDMSLQRTALWKECDDRANERLDKLVEIESEKLALARGKEEDRIMAMDLDKLNPLQRMVIERKQKAIAARWCSQD